MSLTSDPQSVPLREAPRGRPGRVRSAFRKLVVLSLSIAGILLLLSLDNLLGQHGELPMGGESVSYGLLFVVGLFTGFHCVGMCGPLVISYTVSAAKQGRATYLSHLYYGVGKTLSYTLIGALFGALGAIITFTPFIRGVAGIAAGVFLLLFGLSLLNVFARLNRFRIKTPAFMMRFVGKRYKKSSHPFAIGLLNGCMLICGPLQAMYILAAGTGSPAEGARMLFMFGLGTLPVMLGFGFMTSALSHNLAPKLMKASGILVMALGVIMLNRGLAMTGSGYDYHALLARWTAEEAPESLPGQEEMAGYQVIRMEANKKGYKPDQFTLRQGVPVKWIIQGKEIDYCNHRITVPALGLEFDIQHGENVIEFTPKDVGVIPWSCWMGMIPGVFLVHENVASSVPPPAETTVEAHGHHAAQEPRPADEGDWKKALGERIGRWFETLRQRLQQGRPVSAG